MPPVPDLVHLSRLQVSFSPDSQEVRQIALIRGADSRRRKVREEQLWKRARPLGKGGFGMVYLQRCATGSEAGEVRAVKELRKLANDNYNRELEAAALFSQPTYEDSFVKSYGWYESAESIFMTMEYLPHGDLQRYLDSPKPEVEGQAILSQILEGLAFMHERGFTHRDLKPTNILVSEPGPQWWVKIADFGISKRADFDATHLRTQVGTPRYLAPEILFMHLTDDASEGYTNAVDIWAVGLITYTILTAEYAFPDGRKLLQYHKGNVSIVEDILRCSTIGDDGCAFIRTLLCPRPEDRPSSKDCLTHAWLRVLRECVSEQHVEVSLPSRIIEHTATSGPLAPSAKWSTLSGPARASSDTTVDDLLLRRNTDDPSYVSAISTRSENHVAVPVVTANVKETIDATNRPEDSPPNLIALAEGEREGFATLRDIRATGELECAICNGNFQAALAMITEANQKTMLSNPCALIYAILCGHVEVAAALIEHKWDVDMAHDPKGDLPGTRFRTCTPLSVAMGTRRPAMVQLLLQHGASLVCNDLAETWVGYSLAVSMVIDDEWLVRYPPIRPSDIISCIAHAMDAGWRIDQAVDIGFGGFMRKDGRRTLLWKALTCHPLAAGTRSSIVQFLLEKGASPLSTDGTEGHTMLHIAVECNRISVLPILLKQNAAQQLSVKSTDSGCSYDPLCRAVLFVLGEDHTKNRHKIDRSIVRTLIEAGADLNSKNVVARDLLPKSVRPKWYKKNPWDRKDNNKLLIVTPFQLAASSQDLELMWRFGCI